jgi:hypothetical protein
LSNEGNIGIRSVLVDFISYFEKNFIGEISGNTVQNSFYSICFWSVYQNIINGIPRSTCAVEAWHRSLNSICVISHPNFAKFLEVIQKEEEVVRIKILQARNGRFRISEKNYLKEEKLRTILRNLNFLKIWVFLILFTKHMIGNLKNKFYYVFIIFLKIYLFFIIKFR